MVRFRSAALAVCCLAMVPVATARAASVEVHPTVETRPIRHDGDAADDVCIWIHPDDPASSTVIGTDKRGGLAVYDLDGREIQYLMGDRTNNVDLRYGFPLGQRNVDLVVAGNRTRQALSVFAVDPASRLLEAVGEIPVGIFPVGTCMYHSLESDEYYVFVDSYDASVEQWRLLADPDGSVEGELVRSFRVRDVSDEELERRGFAATEGCVADDELGWLYVAEEEAALWKFRADPGVDDDFRKVVHRVGDELPLTPDIEGLAILPRAHGRGYILVSTQGENEFAVLRREKGNKYLGRFHVGAAGGIDEVTHTDGIEVTGLPLGPRFPHGMFVAQDDDNEPDWQNFKLVPWEAIARAFSPPLSLDGEWDPRAAVERARAGSHEPEPGPLGRLARKIRKLFASH